MKNNTSALLLLLALAFSLHSLAGSPVHTKSLSGLSSARKVKYKLVISFISIGAGIDNESYEKITSYIKAHPKKPAMVEVQMGREGERTLYLRLNELSADEQKNFTDEVNKMIVKKDLVKIQEDVKIKKVKAKF